MKRSTAPAGRVTEYEWMRLLATILVVIGHSMYWQITTANGGVYYGSDEFAWISPVYFSWPFALVSRAAGWVYAFHMAAFFFLSGAVQALRPAGAPGAFLAKKAKRLLLPYVVCGLVWMFPLKRITGFYTVESLPAALKAFALGGDDSGHLWFLPALFWCMVLILLFEHTVQRLIRRRWLASVILLIPAAVLQVCAPRMPWLFGISRAAEYFLWFCLGYVFEPIRAALAALPSRWWLALHAAGAVASSVLWGIVLHTGFAGRRSMMLLGCAWLYLLAALCARLLHRVESTRLHRTVMASLFWVYLVHDPLEHLLLHLFMQNRWLASGVGCWAYLLSRTVGAFAFSVAVYALWCGCRALWKKRNQQKTMGKEETV